MDESIVSTRYILRGPTNSAQPIMDPSLFLRFLRPHGESTPGGKLPTLGSVFLDAVQYLTAILDELPYAKDLEERCKNAVTDSSSLQEARFDLFRKLRHNSIVPPEKTWPEIVKESGYPQSAWPALSFFDKGIEWDLQRYENGARFPHSRLTGILCLVRGLNALYAELDDTKKVDPLIAILNSRKELTELLSTGDCGDGPLSIQPKKTGRPGRQPIHKLEPKEEQRIYDLWKKKNYSSVKDFKNANAGLPSVITLKRLIDRTRKREERELEAQKKKGKQGYGETTT